MIRGRNWPLLAVIAVSTAILVYFGRTYFMQIHYNVFLLAVLAMAAAMTVLAWLLGTEDDVDLSPPSGE